MPRDATRSFSRSDSSSCAIRCRLLFEVFGELLLLVTVARCLPLSLQGCGLRTIHWERFRCWPVLPVLQYVRMKGMGLLAYLGMHFA